MNKNLIIHKFMYVVWRLHITPSQTIRESTRPERPHSMRRHHKKAAILAFKTRREMEYKDHPRQE